jgi:two-component system NtrC family sensor kinase
MRTAAVLPQTLKAKVAVYLALGLLAGLVVFMVLVVTHERDELLDAAVARVNQLTDVVIRSTRFSMLQNERHRVHRIIEDIASDKTVDRIRIFNKDGLIVDSTRPDEIGLVVDHRAEGCFSCHSNSGQPPKERTPRGDRARIFSKEDGTRLLGFMQAVHNEPSCFTAACHQHSADQRVLGVVDIVYSLDEIDQTVRESVFKMGAFMLGFLVFASICVAVLVHRLVYVPLRDLEGGAKRLARGDLSHPIVVRSNDEFGQLAQSFNVMTAALNDSQTELREAARTLEDKVEERTRQLHVAELETARSEKLASVGLLAAGIAHELNNPLTGVLTFSHLMRQKLPDGSPDAEDMDLVIRETKRCASIIRRLLDFARQKPPEKKFTDLNRIVEETARFIERPAHLQDTEILLELAPELPQVWVDEDQVKQVVMNMLVNAQHATESGGSITVRTRLCNVPLGADGSGKAVPAAELSIVDTGCGIPESDLKRIFDPFFTSKEVGKGTGLGLSVSHGIVQAHGGLIKVASTVGQGTTFTVYLPIASPEETDRGERKELALGAAQ